MPQPYELPTSITVYCGSYTGTGEHYIETARTVGARLAELGITLVYGGGAVGLMGAVANAALEGGGQVIGVMPRSLVDSEIGHNGLTELHVVETMHERKLAMSQRADAFLALPGGAGTLEEITEQWTWAQLGIHTKPCAFINTAGFFDPLYAYSQRMVDEGFMRADYHHMLLFENTIDAILERLRTYTAPLPKWQSTGPAITP